MHTWVRTCVYVRGYTYVRMYAQCACIVLCACAYTRDARCGVYHSMRARVSSFVCVCVTV